MRREMSDFPSSREEVGEDVTFFVLAGYSWRESAFAIWTLHHQKDIAAFTFREAASWRGVDGHRRLVVVGDSVIEARSRLESLLAGRGKRAAGGFDMEPLEVLIGMIRQGVDRSIGGPPQVLKIYRHMNTQPFGVYWPNRESRGIAVLGRPLLEYEQPNTGVIDPDTMELVSRSDARAV
jgi:hypothetical protein